MKSSGLKETSEHAKRRTVIPSSLRESLERNSLRLALFPKWLQQNNTEEFTEARTEIVKVARIQATLENPTPHVQKLWQELADSLDY